MKFIFVWMDDETNIHNAAIEAENHDVARANFDTIHPGQFVIAAVSGENLQIHEWNS